MSEHLNPSEAVYGFAGWLTTRDAETIMSSRHDCAVIAKLVEEFCAANCLPPVSENWPNNLIHPSGEVAIAGVGHNAGA